MKKFIFLGMAIQAVMTGLLTLIGVIDPKPGQQFIAAGVFILLFILYLLITHPFKSQEKKKKKEELPKGESGEHLIDCYSPPFIPDGWSVVDHKKGGYLKFDPANISLYLSEKQSKGRTIIGNDLRKELADKPVMNANVLGYLFANPELIPETWKGKYIFFWGTIYRRADGYLYVRCLSWSGSMWRWSYNWLGDGFDSDGPAALLNELSL